MSRQEAVSGSNWAFKTQDKRREQLMSSGKGGGEATPIAAAAAAGQMAGLVI